MEKYKILENRPELSAEQVTQGMDFMKVKSQSLILKKLTLKLIIMKTFIATVVITSGIFIYNNFNKPTETKTQLSVITKNEKQNTLKEDTLPKVKEEKIEKALVQPTSITEKAITATTTPVKKQRDLNQLPLTASTNTVEIAQFTASEKKEVTATDTIKKIDKIQPVTKISAKAFKASPNAKCRLWKTESFCSVPEVGNSSISLDCKACDFDYVSCKDLDKNSKLKGVWLTVTVQKRGEFEVESYFKNVTLQKNNSDKSTHPLMLSIGVGGDKVTEKYFGSKFKANDLIVRFKEQIDVFLLFEGAEVGDKLFFEDFVQAEIVE